MERHTLRLAVYLLLIKDNKILLQRRAGTGWMDGMYTVGASGHIEKGESIMQAMIREAKEEANVDVREEDLEVVHTLHRNGNYEYIDIFIKAKNWSGDIKIGEDDKIDELEWFPLGNLPDNTIPYIKTVLENFQKGISFSETGF